MNDITPEQLSAYLDDALPAEERAAVEQALAASPVLKKELEALRRAQAWVRELPPPTVPTGFEQRVLRTIQKPPPRTNWWIVAPSILGAAATAVLMVVVVHQEKPRSRESVVARAVPMADLSITAQAKTEADPLEKERLEKNGVLADREPVVRMIAPVEPQRNRTAEGSVVPGVSSAKGLEPASTRADPRVGDGMGPLLAAKPQAVGAKGLAVRAASTIRMAAGVETGQGIVPSSPALKKRLENPKISGVDPTPPTPTESWGEKEKRVPQDTSRFVGLSELVREPAKGQESFDTLSAKPQGLKEDKAKAALPLEWRGDDSGITEFREVVVRSENEWKSLWKEHTAPRFPPPPPPVVDFNRFMVVGVFLGTRSSGGYAVDILSVVTGEPASTVTYRETRPPADSMQITVLTQPHHLRVVPRRPGSVRFIKK